MQTGIIGRNRIFLTTVDSTNSYAMQLLKNVKPEEGTVVYAKAQTQGRGQRSKVWESEPGLNITMSVILYPSFLELKNQRYLYQIAALACHDTIATILDKGQFDIKIKWPNDILVNSRKVCGILIENNIMDAKIHSAVIGIGLNVNQKIFTQQTNAGSLSLFCEQDLDTSVILKNLCAELDKFYCLLREENPEVLDARYQNLLFGRNEWRAFLFQGKQTQLKVIGTCSSGLLLVEGRDGKTKEVDAQELTWIF